MVSNLLISVTKKVDHSFQAVFWMPGFREVAHGSGACKSSKESIEYLLRYEILDLGLHHSHNKSS